MKQRIEYAALPQEFLKGLFETGAYLKRCGLNEQLVELIKYRVSQINGCAYCLDMHHKDAIHIGETEQRLHGLAAWRETGYYTAAEAAALTYAEAVITGTVTDDQFDALSPFYKERQVADLTLVIITVNSWNMLNKAFAVTPGGYQVGMFDAMTA